MMSYDHHKRRFRDTVNRKYYYQKDDLGIDFISDDGDECGILVMLNNPYFHQENCTGLKGENGELIYANDTNEEGWVVTYVCDTGENLGMEVGWYLVSPCEKYYSQMISRINDNGDNYEITGNTHEPKTLDEFHPDNFCKKCDYTLADCGFSVDECVQAGGDEPKTLEGT